MLDIEQSVKVHLKLSKNELNVNSFVNMCYDVGKNVSQSLFVSLFKKAQESVLDIYLGTPWQKSPGLATPWECPKCAARAGFVRRGKRIRKLKTSIGQVSFPLHQITCTDCGKTFSPFPELFGIEKRQRLSRELEQKFCRIAKDMSYGKTAKLVNEVFDLDISPRTVHSTVQKYGAFAKVVEDLSQIKHLQADSTKINASAKERGIDVHLAICIGPSEQKNGRLVRKKTLASVQVSEKPAEIKKLLKQSQVDQLTVDGKSGLESYIETENIPTTVQRCLWHIPRTAAHMMYLDGHKIASGREFVAPLKGFLFDESLSVNTRLEKYSDFIAQCRDAKCEKTVNFLENAAANLYTHKQFEETDVYGRTNSIVERQMREINRRMENGSRWSKAGANNLLKLKFIEEMNPESYAFLWKLSKNKLKTFKVILC
jgi:ssDNA-binding Zn-finger/Zn-ribbon topoisomerase 1